MSKQNMSQFLTGRKLELNVAVKENQHMDVRYAAA